MKLFNLELKNSMGLKLEICAEIVDCQNRLMAMRSFIISKVSVICREVQKR
jgi:hypothetical protein